MADHQRPSSTRRRYSAQQDLGELLAAVLAQRQQEWLAQGRNAAADKLARLGSSAGVAGLVRELKRKASRGEYFRPTLAAFYWRELRMRRLLQRDPQYTQALKAFRFAAHNEAFARVFCAADVVCWLAEAVTQPDESAKREIDTHRRSAEGHRRAYQFLNAKGLVEQAETHLREGVKHLVIANKRGSSPTRQELLRATCRWLESQFGIRGYRIAAGLVTAALALDERISRSSTQRAVKFFTQ